MTGVVGSFILSDITYTFLWSSSHTIILYPYICIKRDSEGKKKVGKRKQMQNRSSNDTNRALNNGVKKDIVQFHPLVSIIYLHIISRSRSIKGCALIKSSSSSLPILYTAKSIISTHCHVYLQCISKKMSYTWYNI